jgi:hypothetical protein
MYEDIYPEKKKKPTITVRDFETGEEKQIELEITKDGNIKRKKINLFPKGQTTGPDPAGKPSKKAKKTMKRALAIRKYIKKGEKDKE